MIPVRFILPYLLFLAPLLAQAAPASASVREVHRTVAGTPFLAFILPVGNEDRLAIRLYEPRRLAEFSLLSADGQQGAHIEQIEWSSDGQYLVFSTTSSGGHPPWNSRTYAFSTATGSFLSLDDVVSPVTSPTFSFTDASHVEVEALKTPSSSADDTAKRTIDLAALPWNSAQPVAPPSTR
jgi:hypothetical protein